MRIVLAAIGLMLCSLLLFPSPADTAGARSGLALQVQAEAPQITRGYMVGEWVTRNVEFGRDVEIGWTVRADGTLSYRFKVDGTSSEGSPGTWAIDNDVVTEHWQRPFGLTGTGTARIEAIDQNTMRLTIIDNGHPEYAGMVRIYRRLGGPQLSMHHRLRPELIQ